MTYPTQPKASHFVNGQYIDDETGTPLPVIYPATGEEIARLYEATPDILNAAISAAEAAQKEWAKLSGMERGRALRRAAKRGVEVRLLLSSAWYAREENQAHRRYEDEQPVHLRSDRRCSLW